MSRLSKSTLAMLTLAMTSTLSVAVVGSFTSNAEAQRWDRNLERQRQGRVIDLGYIQIGDGRRGESSYRLDLSQNPGLQCNLSHIKFTATGDSVWLTRAFVEYARADRFGQMGDILDLNSGQPPMAPPPGRPGRHRPPPAAPAGIQLAGYQQSEWLSVDDVMDGFPDGRCIRAITFYGIDTPDFAGPGRVERHDPPAMVKLDGYITRQGPGAGPGRPPRPGGGGVGPGLPPGPGGGGIGSGPVRPRPLQFKALGSTGRIQKFIYEYIEVQVGTHQGRFDGIKIIAKDDSVDVKSARVYFGNGEYVELANLKLRENQEVYFDFDGPQRRGARDQDRFITKVTFEAVSSNSFGSKGRIDIEGGR